MYPRKNGQTSNIIRVKLQYDAGAANPGDPVTGLTSASSGLKISTIADNEATATAYSGSNLETISTLGTFAAPTSGKCRFKEVDASNHPGWYEIQIADARFAVANAKSLGVTVSGVTDMLQCDLVVELWQVNPYSANAMITGIGGVSPPTNWNLLGIDGNGRVDMSEIQGVAQTGRDMGAGVLLTPGGGTGEIMLSAGAVTAGTVGDKNGYALTSAYDKAKMNVALAEGYAADTVAPTLEQLLFMIAAKLGVFARDVVGVTETGYKLDKSTPAMTWTLSDPDTPTSNERAS